MYGKITYAYCAHIIGKIMYVLYVMSHLEKNNAAAATSNRTLHRMIRVEYHGSHVTGDAGQLV